LASGSKLAPSTDDAAERLLAPVAIDFAARRRFSVSRLSGELQLPPDRTAMVTPSADDEAGSAAISSMDFGTFVHRVLAAVPLSGKIDMSTVVMNAFGDTAEDLQSEALPLIETFLKSARAAELTAAKQVYRELEFMLAWPPDRPQAASQPPRYLQGFIDCLYQDRQGRWHLVDYKTNRISADRLVDAAVAYEMQLGVYALAATQILGEPPVELTIHFLRPSLEHSFVWDDAMRRGVIGRVDEAIASVRAGSNRQPRTEMADSA
jgi:ATP-dependent exoDNAse (exonuclease V) beta subunit